MNRSRIESELWKLPLIWLALPFLGVVSVHSASAQEENFSLAIISDPQIWRAHNPRDESGNELCPADGPDKSVACGELKTQCAKDLITRPDNLCNALAAHDALVEAINDFIGRNAQWPEDMVCPPVGTADPDNGCISDGTEKLQGPPDAVIINGDLTENFGEDELLAYRLLYQVKLGETWPGLGNHDYQNNYGRNLDGQKNARNAAEVMANTLSQFPSLVNYDLIGEVAVSNRTPARKGFRVRATGKRTGIFTLTALQTRYFPLGDINSSSRQPWKNIVIDFYDRRLRTCGFLCLRFEWVRIDSEPVNQSSEVACFDVGPLGALKTPCILREGKVDRVGSLSYSIDKGNYRFIQLHNYLGYEVDLTNDDLAPKDPPIIGPPIQGGFDIKSAEDWLKSELTQATDRGKAIVINVHDVSDNDALRNFIQDNSFNNIVAVFAGHVHERVGQVNQWTNASGRSVPVILSGATFTGTMLNVEFFDDHFNWAVIRAWPKRNFDRSGEHEGEQNPQDRPRVECNIDPDRNIEDILKLINDFALFGLFDNDEIDNLFDNDFDRLCHGKADPVFVKGKTWAYHHSDGNTKKQGTVTFNLTDLSDAGGAVITPPIASCSDVVVYAGPQCDAEASIDNGSFDSDGGLLTLQQNPPGPYGVGEHNVTLTVLNESGATDSCEATVIVTDIEKPQLSCGNPPRISPPRTPVSFTATGTDNCGIPDVYIEDHACFRLNGSGRRIDLNKSCKPEVFVDTMTVTKSNGVGTRISWSSVAEDENGNVTTKTCSVDVVGLPEQSATVAKPVRKKKLK